MPTCPQCLKSHPAGTSLCTVDGTGLLPDEAFANADKDLHPGTKAGEYEIETKLGEGGFGSVYRAMHPVIGKIAAVKVLHRSYSSDPQIVSRFIAEARAVNQIRHPNIIDIFSFGRLEDGRSFFVMEFLEGQSLENLLRTRERLSLAEAIPIFHATARAIDAAHAAGIAHRDLKPDNIYLSRDSDGRLIPKLLDFGIAKLFGDASPAGHKTRTGAPIGTPDYMSPEQCRGEELDHRTDIYSFGVLVHRVLTGSLPFQGKSVLDLLYKHSQIAPPPMSESGETPPELDAPVLGMLAKAPADRPTSVLASVDALVQAAAAAGISVEMPVDSGMLSLATPSQGPSVRVVTGADRKQSGSSLVDAKTLLQEPPSGTGATLIGAEKDVAGSKSAPPKSNKLVIGAVIAVLGLAALALAMAVMMVAQNEKDKVGQNRPTPASTPTSTTAPGGSATTGGPSVSATGQAASESGSAAGPASATQAPSSSASTSSSARASAGPRVVRPPPKREYEDPFR